MLRLKFYLLNYEIFITRDFPPLYIKKIRQLLTIGFFCYIITSTKSVFRFTVYLTFTEGAL